MLKLIKEKTSCDLKRIARINNEILFVELFGRNQILKSLSASILEKRGDFVISGNERVVSILVNKGAKYKRKIVPLSDGYAHCIVYQDELFSERFILAKNNDDRKRAFQIWLCRVALPIPYKNNPVFIDALYEEIHHALDWKHMESKNTIEKAQRVPAYLAIELTKKEPLSFCCMDSLIQQEYMELVEAVEFVFANYNKKVA
ncbi:MAG: hypothetical protein K2O80_03755 [Helicobacter apodemus]|nr:hypothetical protein [Helicobacter apodemus]